MRLLPWLFTAAIVAYIGRTTDLTTAWSTLERANWAGFLPVAVAVCIIVFLLDSGSLVLLFRRFNAPVTYREMLPLKGTSYFLNIINYNAAAAGIALFFRNKKRVPLLKAMSTMLWLNFVDIVSLATLMLLGMAIGGGGIDPSLRSALVLLALGILVVLVGSCIYWNAGFDFFILGRFRNWQIFDTFKKATLRDYGVFVAIRTGFVATYIIAQWASMPFFDMHATLRELMLYVPALTFVGTIPFTTIAGFGTVQVLMRDFFAGFAPHGTAQIDAFSTTTILAFVVCRVIIGYACMGSVSRDFTEHSRDPGHSAETTESVRQ